MLALLHASPRVRKWFNPCLPSARLVAPRHRTVRTASEAIVTVVPMLGPRSEPLFFEYHWENKKLGPDISRIQERLLSRGRGAQSNGAAGPSSEGLISMGTALTPQRAHPERAECVAFRPVAPDSNRNCLVSGVCP